MVNLGIVQQDSTVRFYMSTSAADGGREDFSATLEQADVVIVKDGAVMTLDASTITFAAFNSDTGIQEVEIDLSNDSDFTGGSRYWVYVHPDETIDAQSVAGVLGLFTIESNTDQAIRLLRESLYPSGVVISTVTSNSTTAINLTDVADAQTQDLALEGMTYLVYDATDGRIEVVVATSVSSKVATVERISDGSAMSFTVASGDRVIPIGPAVSHRLTSGARGDFNDLSAAQVNTQVDTAISDYFGAMISDAVNDGSATASSFTVDTTQGSNILVGVLRFTSGSLDGEARLVHWTGTTVEVGDPDTPVAGLTEMGPFSAGPADNDTFVFLPLS